VHETGEDRAHYLADVTFENEVKKCSMQNLKGLSHRLH